jgi:hypothetical protein
MSYLLHLEMSSLFSSATVKKLYYNFLPFLMCKTSVYKYRSRCFGVRGGHDCFFFNVGHTV